MTDVLKALSDPTRREILFALRGQDLTAGEIASKFSQRDATISHHLAVLREADLVRSRKNGTQIIYSISTSVLQDVLTHLMTLTKPNEEEVQ